jgi:hypothetical protein
MPRIPKLIPVRTVEVICLGNLKTKSQTGVAERFTFSAQIILKPNQVIIFPSISRKDFNIRRALIVEI